MNVNRTISSLVRISLVLPAVVSLFMSMSACTESVRDTHIESALPDIYPNYHGVTVPVNIAPLNFSMSADGYRKIDAVVTDSDGRKIHGQGDESTSFNLDQWHELLSQNVGDSLYVTVSAKDDDGWHTFLPFSIFVSPDSIDYGIVYRLIEPGYEVWSKMGIYERSLSSFDETPLIENTEFDGCVNCHSFNRADPRDLSLHIRGAHGATILRRNGQMTAYNTATSQTLGLCVYPYWHPSGKYIAYSTNTTRQVFHISHNNRVEVFDAASDIQVYDIDNNELIVTPLLKRDSIYETFPAFSADGKTLYFCAANALPDGSSDFQKVHYSLCSVSFDESTGSFGNHIDTLVDCSMCCDTIPGSVSFPRPSYDGRFLVYTYADYGQFTIWHHEADLWIMDLATGECRNLTKANSADTDSFHNWSSNSRWMVISSRRDDGLFTRPYFCHIDAEGNASKAFMLPQKNPKRHYQELYMSYNVPDFIDRSVAFDNVAATDLINQKERKPMKVREQ